MTLYSIYILDFIILKLFTQTEQIYVLHIAKQNQEQPQLLLWVFFTTSAVLSFIYLLCILWMCKENQTKKKYANTHFKMIDSLFLMRKISNGQSKANQKKIERKKLKCSVLFIWKGKRNSNNRKEISFIFANFHCHFFPFNFDHIFFAFEFIQFFSSNN